MENNNAFMAKVTLFADDGTATDFNDQAFTDAAVAAALAATPAPTSTATFTDTTVVVNHSDGTTQTFELPVVEPVEPSSPNGSGDVATPDAVA